MCRIERWRGNCQEEEWEDGYTGCVEEEQKGRNGLHLHFVIRQHWGGEEQTCVSLVPWPVSMETNSHPYTYSVVPACSSNGLLTRTFACDTGYLFGRLQWCLLSIGRKVSSSCSSPGLRLQPRFANTIYMASTQRYHCCSFKASCNDGKRRGQDNNSARHLEWSVLGVCIGKFVSELKVREFKRDSSGAEGQPLVVRSETALLRLIIPKGKHLIACTFAKGLLGSTDIVVCAILYIYILYFHPQLDDSIFNTVREGVSWLNCFFKKSVLSYLLELVPHLGLC